MNPFNLVRDALSGLSKTATSVASHFNQPIQAVSPSFKPLFNTPLANNKPINYPQVAQQAASFGSNLVQRMMPVFNQIGNQPLIKPVGTNFNPFPQVKISSAASMIPSIWQAPLRSAVNIKQTPLLQHFFPGPDLNQNIKPQGLLQKAAFGSEPMTSLFEQIRQGMNVPFVGNVKGAPAIPLVIGATALNLIPMTSVEKTVATEAISLAKNAKSVETFTSALSKAKPEVTSFVTKILKDTKNPINTVEDFFAVAKDTKPTSVASKLENLPPMRTGVKTGSYTNTYADNRLLSKELQTTQTAGINTISENGLSKETQQLAGQTEVKGLNPALPHQVDTNSYTPLTGLQDLERQGQVLHQTNPSLSSRNLSFGDIVQHSSITPKQKVGFIDYIRTPDRVLAKIGLGQEATNLRKAYDSYLKELPQQIDKVSQWAKRADSPQSSKFIFQYLDGKKVNLSANDLAIAKEVKTYLGEWADRLGLPKDNRITTYITHIFDKDFIQKEFDPDIAALIRDKVAGSVYDPFTEQRLGKQGYIEDAWRALDAYVKRGVRKANMDPVLSVISQKSQNLEDSQFNYVKRYIDRVNLRPTEIDTLIDNQVKQVVGYRFGQRPTTVLTQKLRQAVYRGTLGLNIGSALKNLTQGANTYAKLGEKYTIVGYTNLVKSLMTGSKELEEVGVLGRDIVQDRTINATRKLWENTDKGLFAFFEGAEKINRGAAYFGAKAKALSQGMNEEKAIEYAKKIVRDTQFQFGSIDTPQILQSDLAKTVLQFQSFNLKQSEFLAGMIKSKDVAGLIRYFGASTVITLTVGQAFGMKLTDMIPFWGVATGDTKLGQTPPIKLGMDIGQAIVGAKDQYGAQPSLTDRAATIGNDFIPLIPGGVQAKKTIQGLQAYQQGASRTPSGRERFNVEQTPFNFVRAATLGQYNLPGAQDYFNNIGKSKSEIIYNGLKDLKTPQEKAARWDALVKDGTINSSNKSDIRQYFIDESIGLSDDEKKIRGLAVRDGSRATRIIAELNKLDNPKAKASLWAKYVKAGILTDQVSAQVQHLLRQN